MHNQQEQHLKTNNIISKLLVIILSIVLLTGISLVPALQIGVNGQVQQQQQQPWEQNLMIYLQMMRKKRRR
jgi:uncharacterized lipoprotein YajG